MAKNMVRMFASFQSVITLLSFVVVRTLPTLLKIGMFKIVKEEGIGSGTRRILAVTSREAYLAYREEEDTLKAIAATLKAPQLKEVPNKVASLQEQLHALQKENAALKEKQQLQQLVMSSKTLKKLTVFVTSLAK